MEWIKGLETVPQKVPVLVASKDKEYLVVEKIKDDWYTNDDYIDDPEWFEETFTHWIKLTPPKK